MATATTTRSLPVGLRGKASPAFWGMALLIVNEASFFAYLLFSYFYLAAVAHGAWPPGGRPELKLAIPNTVILLVSSGTMWWAESGVRKGRMGRLKLGLLITFVLGVIFLAIQGVEYASKPFGLRADAYSSLFYTITGFHGAHVAVGLLMNLVVQVWVWRGLVTPTRRQAVTNIAWYWHFVDVVWLAVFTTLYLSPYFGLR
ncbi:MAG TPA: cytochrome c oxidase subunit 3 [Longimicrobiaceae bacterium]|nr:cytochrome c oxidase subunit 3 [Longimicrobiaceae bacterium]